MTRRVILFHNMVAPYRHALFAALAKHTQLRVLYATRITRDRKWDTSIPTTYDSRVLNGPTAYAFGRPITICPNLTRELREYQPHAVFSVLTRSNAIDIARLGLWCTRKKIPLVLWVGDIPRTAGTDEVPSAVARPLGWLLRTTLKRASAFVCYSELSRTWLDKQGLTGRAVVVGTQAFAAPLISPRLEIGERPERIQLLFVGKHEKRKGLLNLIRALQRLPPETQSQLCLTTAGDGPLTGDLRDSCPRAVGLRMLGFQRPDVLAQLYRDADATITPSLYEPWANVLNESMALGTPAIGSVQSGGVELVRRAGWTVDAFDPDSIAQGIIAAMSQARSEARRRNAVLAEAEYRPEPVAARIAALMDSL